MSQVAMDLCGGSLRRDQPAETSAIATLAVIRSTLNDALMLLRSTGLSVLLQGLSVLLSVNAQGFIPTPAERQLSRISAADADALISKLAEAKGELRKGKILPLLLISGSLASLDKARLSPRDAFLKIPFGDVWDIERLTTDTWLPQRFRLAYSPKGLGQLYWNIEVSSNIDGSINRVTMTYEPPAPF